MSDLERGERERGEKARGDKARGDKARGDKERGDKEKARQGEGAIRRRSDKQTRLCKIQKIPKYQIPNSSNS